LLYFQAEQIMARGKFLTVEGGEGVGKSSFIALLKDRLEAFGAKVVCTREPGGTALADNIRQVFVNPPTNEAVLPLTELFLVSAARHQHTMQFIYPQLDQGTWVLCDRYADSTRVYQGLIQNLDDELCETVIRTSTNGLVPDLTLVLDCPVEVSCQRLAQREAETKASRFDKRGSTFHQQIRDGFLRLADRDSARISVLDACGPSQSIVEQALATISDKGWLHA
jgi:dTMP kinase